MMSAQYRPYRDDEASDTAEEQTHWVDNEPGSVQIYEKTTEPVTLSPNRRMSWLITVVIIVSAILGFCLGYLSHSKGSDECFSSSSPVVRSMQHPDLNVRNFILESMDGKEMKQVVKDLSSYPRLPTSDGDTQSLHLVSRFFRDNGLQKVHFANYTVLLSLPPKETANEVSILDEATDIVHFSTLNSSNSGSPNLKTEYFAYSTNGSIKGDILFVNNGNVEDYEKLKKLFNIEFAGKLILARRNPLPPRDQAFLAHKYEASGLLLFTDSTHSSYETFHGVKRDSLISEDTGDIETPGYPSHEYVYRGHIDVARSFLSEVPVQPISLHAARKIMSLLGGHDFPSDWNNMSFPHIGPGFKDGPTLKVKLTVNNQLVRKQVSNVIGSIRGEVEPDRYIIIGNHRDSWVDGALDSAAGTASLFQLVKTFTNLRSSGWKPRRTILFCSWAAEEFNNIGSVEWIEDNYELLKSRAIAYISSDIIATGNFSLDVTASPLLFQSIYNSTKLVKFPYTSRASNKNKTNSLYDDWIRSNPNKRHKDSLILHNNLNRVTPSQQMSFSARIRDNVQGANLLPSFIESASASLRPQIHRPKKGFVYSAFFTKVGVPFIDITFVPKKDDSLATSLLHTQYDSANLTDTFDKDFSCHRSVAQVLGEIVRDLADSPILPFNLLDYAQIMHDFTTSLQNFQPNLMDKPNLRIDALDSAVNNFTRASLRFHSRLEGVDLQNPLLVRSLNDQLILVERTFLHFSGLPGNADRKHMVLSPENHFSLFENLDTFPGIKEQIEHLEMTNEENELYMGILEIHFSIIIHTIQSAANSLDELFT